MAKIDNVNGDEFKALMRRVRALETASPIGSSSVTRGALRVASIEGLIVEGSARVTGLLKGVGTFLWENIFNVTGTATFTGTTNVNGPFNVNGNTTQNGNTAQNGDITVQGGGEIVVAGSVPMTLGVTSDGRPGVEFAGGRMTSDGSRIALSSGSATVGAAGTFASLSFGSRAVIAQTDSVYLMGLPTTTNQPNLYIDPDSGKLFRSTAGGVSV